MNILGEKVKIYIQTGDTVIDLTGMIHAFKIEQIVDMIDVTYDGLFGGEPDAMKKYIPGKMNTTFEISGVCLGDPFWTTVQDIKNESNASEWQCPYCQRPNKRKDETCKSCGAVRPFIYG